MNVDKQKVNVKTCLIGTRAVGKTAFINRLIKDTFNEKMNETMINEDTNVFLESAKQKYKLKVMDLPGNRIKENSFFLRNRPFLLMFFDLSRFEETFRNIQEYMEIVAQNTKEERTILLFGTKKDLIDTVIIFLVYCNWASFFYKIIFLRHKNKKFDLDK